jgi:hypothetical protein
MEEEFNIYETRDHSIKSQIDLISKSFPFDEVHKIFTFMNFTYISGLYDEYSPTKEDIKFLAINLLQNAGKRGKKMKTNMIYSSGRFEARWDNDEETLSLKFIPFESEIMVNESEETIYVS